MRKFFVLPMTILLCVFMVTPAFAYTSESFVIDTNPYLFESIQASNFSLRDSASTYAVSAGSSESPIWFLDNCSSALDVCIAGVSYSNSALQTPFSYSYSLTPTYQLTTTSDGYTYTWISRNSVTWSPNPNLHYDSAVFGLPSFTLSLSDLSADSICFSGALRPRLLIWNYPVDTPFFSDCIIYVNGSKVSTLSSDASGFFQFNDFIYSSASGVNSVDLVFIGDSVAKLDITDHLPASVESATVQVYLKSWDISNFSFSTLSEDDILNGYNDNAQDAMNQQDVLESEWTGSMTENFNNLSLSDFSFPTDAVNGFSLISGIFNDLWNAMGDFRIVYVFPLTLGVVLLLIGRLSRTSVKRSSGRGDDDA